MRYRELTKRLRKMGCAPVRPGKGSHQLWYNPATDSETVIPDWGKKDLPPGTVRGILRQLGISRDEFGPIKLRRKVPGTLKVPGTSFSYESPHGLLPLRFFLCRRS